jgi:hypothetical protein
MLWAALQSLLSILRILNETAIVVSPLSITYKYNNESLYELPLDAANRDGNSQGVPSSM